MLAARDVAASYMTVEAVAAYLKCSTRSVHERTRTNAIPCRRLPGSRRYLFVQEEIRAWLDGASLEVVVDGPDGAKVVRPLNGGAS